MAQAIIWLKSQHPKKASKPIYYGYMMVTSPGNEAAAIRTQHNDAIWNATYAAAFYDLVKGTHDLSAMDVDDAKRASEISDRAVAALQLHRLRASTQKPKEQNGNEETK